MESYIQISKINDFLFCPLSLYLHTIYENFDTRGYHETAQVAGKIDIYDSKEKSLIERKNKIQNVYLGYKFQLYAQYFCMTEMGYEVKKLYLHSLTDNKRYGVDLPLGAEKIAFEKVLTDMRGFGPEDIKDHSCERCKDHIYSPLGWR